MTVTSLLSLATDKQTPASVTAELKLYDADAALPVIRNGVVQRPRSRIVDRGSVEIAPGGSSELRLTIPPLDVGLHHGVLQLVGDDALALDDVRFFTVGVLTPSRVLLVADNEDEARSIDLTINAAPFEVDETNAEYLVERIAFADLPVVRLADFDAILLLDPPADVITDDALGDYAAQGGGVLVCLGAAAGNEALTSSWLPPLIRRWRSPAPCTFLEPLRPSHPVLAPLSEIPGGVPWNDYRVQQYWQIAPTESDKVLFRFAGAGHPAVVERSVPVADSLPGIVIITTTPLPDLADPKNDWNDLFGSDAWPAFFLVTEHGRTVDPPRCRELDDGRWATPGDRPAHSCRRRGSSRVHSVAIVSAGRRGAGTDQCSAAAVASGRQRRHAFGNVLVARGGREHWVLGQFDSRSDGNGASRSAGVGSMVWCRGLRSGHQPG